jgi:hypothetical protein
VAMDEQILSQKMISVQLCIFLVYELRFFGNGFLRGEQAIPYGVCIVEFQ